MFIKRLAHFNGFSISGFIMVSSKSFNLNKVFQLLEGSFPRNFSFLQEFPVIYTSFFS